MRTFIVAFIISLLSSLILTRLIRDWAVKLDWLDEGGGRKIHKQPIPRLGGVAILMSALLPLITLGLWDNDISAALWGDKELIFGLAEGLGVIALIGIIDDLKGVPAVVKLGGQVLAGVLAYQAGIHIETLSIPFFHLVELGWMSMPITVFWFVLSMNAVNLIDGMDGLAGSVVMLAGGTLFFMCLVEDQVVASLILLSMLGAVLGFLRYNINPATIFLGDTGSMSLGFLLAIISVHFSQKSSVVFSLVASLMILGLPIFDLSMAIFRRFLSGQKIFSADQYHVHHILLRKGFSQRQSVLVLIVFALGFEALALLHIYTGDQLDAIVLVALVVFLFVSVRLLGYQKIIFTQRKNAVLKSVQTQSEKALKSVLEFKDNVKGFDDEQELFFALELLSDELCWCSLIVEYDGEVVFSKSERERDVHIVGLYALEVPLINGSICVKWLEETSSMQTFDEALVHLVADALLLPLQEQKKKEISHPKL